MGRRKCVKHIWREKLKYRPALKVPRQWPLVLLVEVYLRQGKALGSARSRLFMNKEKNTSWALWSEF
jgi:hypothetical protein